MSKVVINGITYMDLTDDTVTAETLLKGFTAHGADGQRITGTMTAGGGEPVQPKDVNFIDYDGTVLHSYTVAEAAALTALPALPSHDGLICQGWNWTLDDLAVYLAYAPTAQIEIGAYYKTDDGKTRIYISIPNDARKTINLIVTGDKGLYTINWGDGSDSENTTGYGFNIAHDYANSGDYMITIQTSMNHYLGIYEESVSVIDSPGNDYYKSIRSMVRKIEIGDNAMIARAEFQYCSSLETITIPDTALLEGERCGCLDEYSFDECRSLRCVVVPRLPDDSSAVYKNVIEYGNGVFRNCSSLRTVSLPSGAYDGISVEMFAYCKCLQAITIPIGDTIGTGAFVECSGLTKLVIPGSVTGIASDAFYACEGIKMFDFSGNRFVEGYIPEPSVPALESSGAFNSCPSDFIIKVDSTMLNGWKSATNWSTYADHIVGGST